MSKPRILVARAIFPDIVDRLREHFDVEANPDDVIWTPAELGVRPVLVSDAHTCMDTPGLGAEAIVAHHNLTLGSGFATLCVTEAVQF